MMHIAGFEHEHDRFDSGQHLKNYKKANQNSIAVGQYDYNSLMHFGEVDHLVFTKY